MNVYKKIKKAIKEGGVSLAFKRAILKTIDHFTRISYTQNLTHNFSKGLPKVEVQFKSLQTSGNDVRIAERILFALNKAQKDERKNITGDLWDDIQSKQHSDFYAIYHDPGKVAEYMNNMNQHGITFGIASSSLLEYLAMSKNSVIRQEWGVYIKDTMICFAEAVGVIPRNLDGRNLYLDENVLLSRIEEKIGISITPSEIEGGLYALKINKKSFGCRDFWSAYIAWRAHQLVGSDASIAEIGGGIGKAALYANQFGIKNYSLYDLPIINLVQAWFLIKSGMDVVLYGEEGSGMKIMPYWEFEKGSFDLTLNVDSFPEMDGSIVAGYLETVKKNTRKYLLSINREDGGEYGGNRIHIQVPDIVEKVGGLELVCRFPFWFLRNYVEELYEIV